jgi:hypothetical protein
MSTKEDEMKRNGRWTRLLGPVQEIGADAPDLRWAGDADAEEIARLAELDSSYPPRGRVLVADVGGDLWAAISVDDGHAVADPFRPTGELVFHMHQRVRRLRRAQRGRRPAAPRVRPEVRAG